MDASSILLCTPELVTVCATHLPLASVAHAARACSTWRAELSCEDFWRTWLHEQGLTLHTAMAMFERFSGWTEVSRALCTLKRDRWCPALDEDPCSALDDMGMPAQHFLYGIAHGFVPCSDGVFTYHCKGSMPVHYRHSAVDEPSESRKGSGLRIGGNWDWSPDRRMWFPTATSALAFPLRSEHLTGQLSTDNSKIVAFLEQWPLEPLIAKVNPDRCVDAMRCHEQLNKEVICDFLNALGTGPRPSTSCMAHGIFTVHLHFVPPVYIACDPDGFFLTTLARNKVPKGSLQEAQHMVHTLNRRRAGTDFTGVYGRPLPPLYDFICQYESWLHKSQEEAVH